MTSVRVDYSTETYVTREGDPDDKWDRDDTDADTTIFGIHVVEDNKGYRDIDVPFDIDPEKDYYLVWADYDTGDSFGSDGGQVEFIDLFQSREKAEAAVAALEKPSKDYSNTYTRDDGTEIKIRIPWDGYFEHLNSINIDLVRVTKFSKGNQIMTIEQMEKLVDVMAMLCHLRIQLPENQDIQECMEITGDLLKQGLREKANV